MAASLLSPRQARTDSARARGSRTLANDPREALATSLGSSASILRTLLER